MASFKKAFLRTDQNEGGYVNDPSDSGGETFRGISRIFHPDWEGWPLIDHLKSSSDFINLIERDPDINALVEPFYKKKFWDFLNLDLITDEYLAFLIYDAHVNKGPEVTFWVQKILNVMNLEGKLWPDLLEDGVMGPVTASILNQALQKGLGGIFIFSFEALRAADFIRSARERPANEKFFLSWISRMTANAGLKTKY